MSATAIRATGKLPAVTLHTTSGSLNCATSLRGALHNGTPMLVVSGESISYGARGGGPELATAIRPRPAYPKLVEAFGGWGQAVDHPAEIIPALQSGIAVVQEGKPALVDVSLAW